MSARLMTPEERDRWGVDSAAQCWVVMTSRLPEDGACLMPMPCTEHDHLYVAAAALYEEFAAGSLAMVQNRLAVSGDEWDPAFCRECGWLDCECDADDKDES